MSVSDINCYIYVMAQSKISALIGLAVTGQNDVTKAVTNVGSFVEKAAGGVDLLNKKMSAIGVGVAFQSTVTAVHAIGDAFGAAKDVIVGTASSMYDFVASAANNADKIRKFSRLLGMSAVELQQIRSAGQDAGLSIESVDAAMQKFSINTGKAAAGEKAQLDVFNALGVATKNADGSIRSQMDLLLDVSDAYSKLTNAQDKNRISQELFGRSGVQMSGLLEGGSESLRKQFEAFNARGGGISNDMAQNGENFAHSIQFAGEALNSIKNGIVAGMIPAVTTVADNITKFVVENREEIDEITTKIGGSLTGMIGDVAKAAPTILSAVSKIAGFVSAIIDFTGPWIPTVVAFAGVVGGALLTAVTAIGTVVATIGPVLTGTIIPAITGTILPAIVSVAAAAAPVLGIVGLIAAAVVSWGIAIKSVYDNWDMLKSFIVDDVGGAIMEFIDSVTAAFKNSISFILTGIADALQTMSSIPLIGDKFASASSFVRGLTNQISDAGGSAAAANYTGGKSSQSGLKVDFSGMPAGVTVTPSSNFDYGSIDYTTGYAFAP